MIEKAGLVGQRRSASSWRKVCLVGFSLMVSEMAEFSLSYTLESKVIIL